MRRSRLESGLSSLSKHCTSLSCPSKNSNDNNNNIVITVTELKTLDSTASSVLDFLCKVDPGGGGGRVEWVWATLPLLQPKCLSNFPTAGDDFFK